jgi:hypothetical protein
MPRQGSTLQSPQRCFNVFILDFHESPGQLRKIIGFPDFRYYDRISDYHVEIIDLVLTEARDIHRTIDGFGRPLRSIQTDGHGLMQMERRLLARCIGLPANGFQRNALKRACLYRSS